MQPDLSIKIGSLRLKNPVMVASGTFAYGEEFHESLYDISKLGAVVTKGISLKPRAGNPPPRVVETASGMLNSIGLQNVGVKVFVDEKLPFLMRAGATVIVNIFGEAAGDYKALAGLLESEPDVSAIEINISCPNVDGGGMQFGADPKAASRVVEGVRNCFLRPVIVKLTPQVADIKTMARAVAAAGADAISLINTIPAMAIDAEARRPLLANVAGGLSGPAIKPIALKLAYDAARAVDIPVIGMGGIVTAADAVEFLLAGASAIQVGTANFVRPKAALEIIDGIADYCRRNKFSSVGEINKALEIADEL